MSSALFGRFGWALFVLTLLSVIVTAVILPYIMTAVNLVFPAKWVVATRVVVQITFGSWVGTVVASIARIIVWLRAVRAKTMGVQNQNERRDATIVRDFSVWLLGIVTALAAYLTVWVG